MLRIYPFPCLVRPLMWKSATSADHRRTQLSTILGRWCRAVASTLAKLDAYAFQNPAEDCLTAGFVLLRLRSAG